jgi:hypothetical protein
VSTGTVIVLVLVLIAVAAALASRVVHRRAAGAGPREAKGEFAERRRRVDGLGIRPLSDERRAGYARQWTAAQERFIDSPPQATSAASALVTAVAADRGYDVSDDDQLLADLSVYHGRYLDGHRRATGATARAEAAATEELRQALLGHRALFRDLLDTPDDRPAARTDRWTRTGEGQRRPWRPVVPGLNRARRRDGDGIAAARFVRRRSWDPAIPARSLRAGRGDP